MQEFIIKYLSMDFQKLKSSFTRRIRRSHSHENISHNHSKKVPSSYSFSPLPYPLSPISDNTITDTAHHNASNLSHEEKRKEKSIIMNRKKQNKPKVSLSKDGDSLDTSSYPELTSTFSENDAANKDNTEIKNSSGPEFASCKDVGFPKQTQVRPSIGNLSVTLKDSQAASLVIASLNLRHSVLARGANDAIYDADEDFWKDRKDPSSKKTSLNFLYEAPVSPTPPSSPVNFKVPSHSNQDAIPSPRGRRKDERRHSVAFLQERRNSGFVDERRNSEYLEMKRGKVGRKSLQGYPKGFSAMKKKIKRRLSRRGKKGEKKNKKSVSKLWLYGINFFKNAFL